MTRIISGILALAGLAVATTAAEAQDCDLDPIRLFHNQTAESRLVIKAGKRCGIIFGWTDGAVHETLISQKAKVGSAVTDHSRVIYVSKPGYTGADEFTYARKGLDRYGNPSVMSAHIKVNVIP
jgi:hypothetical protein